MSSILQHSMSLNVDIVELSDINALSSLNYRHTPDILIVNPLYSRTMTPNQMRSDTGNSELKIVALQNSFVDPAILQSYDNVITIYDSIESITEKILASSSNNDENEKKREVSSREKQIIVCVVKGFTNKQIAEQLNLSAHTVIAHRRNISNKLKIHSPSGLTIYAIVNKLIDITEVKSSRPQDKDEAI